VNQNKKASGEEIYQLRQLIGDIFFKEVWLIFFLFLLSFGIIGFLVHNEKWHYRVEAEVILESQIIGNRELLPWVKGGGELTVAELEGYFSFYNSFEVISQKSLPFRTSSVIRQNFSMRPTSQTARQQRTLLNSAKTREEQATFVFAFDSYEKDGMSACLQTLIEELHSALNRKTEEDMQKQLSDVSTKLGSVREKLQSVLLERKPLQDKIDAISIDREMSSALDFVIKKTEESQLLESAIKLQESLVTKLNGELAERLKDPIHLSLYDQSFGVLRNSLIELYSEKSALEEVYHAGHAKLRVLETRISAIENRISEEERKFESELAKISVDPMARELFNEKTRIERELFLKKGHFAALKSLISQKRQRHEELDFVRSRLNALSTIEKELVNEEASLSKIQQFLLLNLESVAYHLDLNKPVTEPFLFKNHFKKFGYVLALIIGVLLTVVIIFIKYFLSGRFLRFREIFAFFKQPVFGLITTERKKVTIVFDKEGGTTSECFRKLRTNISFLAPNARKICVCSSERADGKTFVAINTAISLSMSGAKVLLVDGDMKLPRISKLLQIESDTGFVDVLEDCSLEELVKKTAYPGLDLLPAGTPRHNSSDLMQSNRLDYIIKVMEEKYDYIIMDTSPLTYSTEAFILARYCDLVLVVICLHKTKIANIEQSMNELRDLKIEHLGLVVNKVQEVELFGGYKYRYKYYYSEGR
jgi:capsular exopolysaccharide synthesis family protein